jgi:hypothetical protein
MLNDEEMNQVFNRLKNHPEIFESIKDLLDISEGVKGIEKADDAEFALIPEVRGLGKKILHDWAKHQTKKKEKEALSKHLKQHSKKINLAYNVWINNHRGTMFYKRREIIKAIF